MKKVLNKRLAFTRRPLAVALASALLLSPGAALAESMFMIPLAGNPDMSRYDSNYIELGGLFHNKGDDSGAFGAYNGVRDQGLYFIGGFNLFDRNDQTATYHMFYGRNLGLDSRQVGGSFGTQGQYGLFADFSQIYHLSSDSTQFFYDGLGGSILTLPTGFSINTGVPHSYDIEQKRNIYKFGGNVFFNGQIEGLVNFRIDDRRGDVVTGTGTSLAPRPVDDNTQQMEAKLRWNTEKAQLEGMYYFSRYSNDNNSLTWNPTNSPTNLGRLSLDPSNYFHQFQLSGGYSFTPTTRFTGIASYGMMRQDDAFLPYSINNPTPTNGLPRNSLDGAVDTILLDLKLTTRLFDKLNLKANYYYNDYNNKTPTDAYYPISTDGTGANNTAYYNSALSSTQNKAGLDASYLLGWGITARGYYTFNRVDYSPDSYASANYRGRALREYTDDNVFGVELLKRASAWVTGSLKYEYQQRRGGDIITPVADTIPKYTVADYNQNKLQGKVFVTPADALAFSLTGDWYKRDYQDITTTNGTPIGVQEGVGQSYTIDGQWTPINGFSAYAFYTWSQLRMEQINSNGARGFTPNNESNTIGVGLHYQPESRNFDVGVQYVWDDNKSPIDDIWPATATSAMPDASYRMDYIQLYGSYQVNKNIKLRANCAYARVDGKDWRYDNLPAAIGNIYLANQTTVNYNDYLVAFSVAYSW